jgi:hypothetical protein
MQDQARELAQAVAIFKVGASMPALPARARAAISQAPARPLPRKPAPRPRAPEAPAQRPDPVFAVKPKSPVSTPSGDDWEEF